MADEKEIKCSCKCRKNFGGGGCGGIYFFGVLASLFYFLPQAGSASTFIFAIFKSLFWPSLFVFKALQLWKF